MSMFHLVSADWVEQRLEFSEFLLLDPRSPIRYMAGHPKNAVNFPVAKQRDANGRLLPPDELARRLGAAGLDANRTPVLYDNSDGRNAAFLAWILAYLGRDDVHLMETFWEQWLAGRREVFYRPVAPAPQTFTAKLRPELRATTADVQMNIEKNDAAKLLDLRTADEFSGDFEPDPRPGRIPGAIHLCCDQIGANGKILRSSRELEEIFASRGLTDGTPAIAYCRTGLRAALGFLALAQMGCPVSLYDGSYSEWSAAGLPVENDSQQIERKNEKGESAHV
ncbi:MAG TPA: rhodanese-like domain-containing protein [Candidatus Acidoferrales bacterium]|nr:rhodanese-like domain-containing protein [Candidatus Acidoferrales bacterium]